MSRKQTNPGSDADKQTKDDIAFAKLWQRAGSVAEVVATTGLPPKVACQRAARMRRRGVKLRTFKSHGKLDVTAINAAIAK